jgi:hypothetical protein
VARRQAALAEQAAPPQQYEPDQYDAPAAPAPTPASPPAEDPYERLKRLGELHAAGILTDEEFAAEKEKILGTG